ncbi:MAG: Acg family FMN-binding oxidoreductase [Hyphomicrobiales bacterium]
MPRADPWAVRATDFPAEGSSNDKLRFLLNYAVLAPSSHNSQPWLFRLHGEEVDLIADRTRALPVIDPRDRELLLSCGAALGMLRVAMRAFGYAGEVALLPNPGDEDLLARIGLGRLHQTTVGDIALRDAILGRRTTRVGFEPRPLPLDLIAAIKAAAAEDWVRLCVHTSQEMRAEIAALVADADRIQFADPSFRRELSAWMHSRHGFSRDGMSLASMGVPDLLTPISALAIRTFDMGEGRAAASQDIANGAPVLAILATDRDDPEDWLLAGQALSRVLLIATVAGVTSGYLDQPIELPLLRQRLADTMTPPAIPQLLLRLGYGPPIAPAARRSVEDALMGEAELTHL